GFIGAGIVIQRHGKQRRTGAFQPAAFVIGIADHLRKVYAVLAVQVFYAHLAQFVIKGIGNQPQGIGSQVFVGDLLPGFQLSSYPIVNILVVNRHQGVAGAGAGPMLAVYSSWGIGKIVSGGNGIVVIAAERAV